MKSCEILSRAVHPEIPCIDYCSFGGVDYETVCRWNRMVYMDGFNDYIINFDSLARPKLSARVFAIFAEAACFLH
jgi:hypothetical protein